MSTPHEQHYDQDRWNGNTPSNEQWALCEWSGTTESDNGAEREVFCGDPAEWTISAPLPFERLDVCTTHAEGKEVLAGDGLGVDEDPQAEWLKAFEAAN